MQEVCAMYSVVLLMAVTTGGEAADSGRGCRGCRGYCGGCYCSCGGCYGGGCHRARKGCHGCYGGGCYASYGYGGCYGGGYGGCYGGAVVSSGCYGGGAIYSGANPGPGQIQQNGQMQQVSYAGLVVWAQP